VAKGSSALPFIVDRLRAGDFLMNTAMQRITGVQVRSLYDEEIKTSIARGEAVGEQRVSELWLTWWDQSNDRSAQ
jgi:hypothetical protein